MSALSSAPLPEECRVLHYRLGVHEGRRWVHQVLCFSYWYALILTLMHKRTRWTTHTHRIRNLINEYCFSPGSLTNLLQKAAVNIIDQADCQHSYGNVLTPNMMCAGHMDGGRDTCLVRCDVDDAQTFERRLVFFVCDNLGISNPVRNRAMSWILCSTVSGYLGQIRKSS